MKGRKPAGYVEADQFELFTQPDQKSSVVALDAGYRCNKCDAEFRDIRKLREHFEEEHQKK